jgi:hypothetical protein
MTTFQPIQSFRSQYFIEERETNDQGVGVTTYKCMEFPYNPAISWWEGTGGTVHHFFSSVFARRIKEGYIIIGCTCPPSLIWSYLLYLAAQADEWYQSTKHFMPWLVTDTLSQINNAAHTRNPNHRSVCMGFTRGLPSSRAYNKHKKTAKKVVVKANWSSFLILFISSLFTHSCHDKEKKRQLIRIKNKINYLN